jgi:hypothetical protein
MNTSEFLITRGRGSLGKGRKEKVARSHGCFRVFSAEAAGGEVISVERYEAVFSETRGAQH